MIITDKNRELMKAFIRILRDIGIPRMTSEMICSMLKSKAQLDEMVDFIEATPNVTEIEVLEKAEKIAE